MKRLSLYVLVVVLIALASAYASAAKKAGGHVVYKAALVGTAEVAPVTTEAKGEVTFEPIEGGKELRYTLRVKGIDDVTAAHMHFGKKGTNGPPVVGLFSGPEKKGAYSGILAKGVITDKKLVGPLSGKTVKDLIKDIKDDEIYVNVHTVKNPDGEIRGWLEK